MEPDIISPTSPKTSTEDPMSKDHKKAKAASLKDLSSMVLFFLKEKGTATFLDVANHALKVCGSHDQVSEKTLKRRVYDVLNVLIAAGIISKEGKTLHYEQFKVYNRYSVDSQIKAPSNIIENQETENQGNTSLEEEARISQKRQVLSDKINLYILNKLLLHRNTFKIRPNVTTSLPAIFVGFSNVGNGKQNGLLNGRQLEISASSAPQFFSPKDVLEALHFSIQDKHAIFKKLPDIQGMEPFLFPSLFCFEEQKESSK